MAFDFLTTVLYLAASVSAYTLYAYIARRQQPPQPPGPRGWPIVGNLKIPDEPAHKVYRQWSEQYGSDVVRTNVLGLNVVILNKLEACTDLLEKRSSMYSNRPTQGRTMLRELVGLDWPVIFMQPDRSFRDVRTIYQHSYGPQAIREYRQTEVKAAHILLQNLCTSPNDFFQHIRHAVGHDLIYSAYGVETERKNDPLIATVEHGLEGPSSALNPGTVLVDLIPILKYIPEWFPGAEFKRKAKGWRAAGDMMVHVPYNKAKQLLRTGGLPDDCAAKSLLTDTIPSSDDKEHMEYVVRCTLATSYTAGTGTIVSGLESFFLAMTIHPEIQKKAQQEVDSVCLGRLPDFSDYDSMPYVRALVKEILRWNPIVPLNLVHVSTQDDIYNGYYIPKGSLILANIWALLHDPEVYADPETFSPERFLRLHSSGAYELDPNVRDPDAAFGFGRRICPGRYMAQEVMWITIASVLAAFDILRAKDEQGHEIVPPEEYAYGFFCTPKPFPCTILPRSGEHENLISNTADQDA